MTLLLAAPAPSSTIVPTSATAPARSIVVLPFYSDAAAFPALRLYTRPQLPSLVAADIGVVGPMFFVRTTRGTMLTGVATPELSNLLTNADLHISSYVYHPEDASATLVIGSSASLASPLASEASGATTIRAYHLPAPMHSSEAMAIERCA